MVHTYEQWKVFKKACGMSNVFPHIPIVSAGSAVALDYYLEEGVLPHVKGYDYLRQLRAVRKLFVDYARGRNVLELESMRRYDSESMEVYKVFDFVGKGFNLLRIRRGLVSLLKQNRVSEEIKEDLREGRAVEFFRNLAKLTLNGAGQQIEEVAFVR